MRKRSHRKPVSAEVRAEMARRAREQHARRRGYEIQPEDRPLYYSMQRKGMRPQDLPDLWKKVAATAFLLLAFLASPAPAHEMSLDERVSLGVSELEAQCMRNAVDPKTKTRCCDPSDCRALDLDEVEALPNAYRIKATGEVINANDTVPTICARYFVCRWSAQFKENPNGIRCFLRGAGGM